MRPLFTTQMQPDRHRRIGRKALQADRLTMKLMEFEQKKTKRAWRVPVFKPRIVAATCVLAIVIGAIGLTGLRHYTTQANAVQQAAAYKQQIESKAKSVAANACRREKAAQKADLIGKITYDELYDYGECDK